MTKTTTFTVRGHKVRSASKCRFVVVAVRAEPFVTEEGTYVAFAEIRKRSDSYATAQTHARRMRDNGGRGHGMTVVVVDTETGEEV